MKLLITGSSGFLGVRITQHYGAHYHCLTPGHGELDITDKRSCLEFINAQKPDYVIHSAAVSDTGVCERDPELSRRVNVMGTVNLTEACAAAGSRMIFMSSDQVYNGSRTTAPNRESDECAPINVYGRHKLEAEQRMLEVMPEAIALRLTWMYDLPVPQLGTKANFLTQLLDSAKQGKQISYSDCEYRGITYVREVVENIEKLFAVPGGIYNFGSHAKDTTYMLAQRVLQMIGAVEMPDRLAAVPRNLAMDPARLNQYQIFFSENEAGIRRCLSEHGIRMS